MKMVSIPEWSKLRGFGDTPKETPSPESKYHKKREEEFIKKAEERGYFLKLSRNYLEEKFLDSEQNGRKSKRKISVLDKYENKEKDLDEIQVVKLTHARLRNVGELGLCHRLSICILSNNYITRFDALVSCVNLIKLDLHSNQITMFPSGAFWMGMEKLQLLHLHDNPIGKIENLHYLGSAPNLSVLTLFDTPLSLKKNYRHHVVNSIWTLKALDMYVISDEEIIEDASFGGKYTALSSSFAVNLCPVLPENAPFREELASAFSVLQTVNQVLAKLSPVVTIQRYIRGFLTRRRQKVAQDYKICQQDSDLAAVTIQRQYRQYKGLETPSDIQVPPPPSPLTRETSTSATVSKPSEIKFKTQRPVDEVKLDYDTYLQNRRPGSPGFSDAYKAHTVPKLPLIHGEAVVPDTPMNSAKSAEDKRCRSLFINLAKLQNSTLQNLQEDSVAMEMAMPSDVMFSSREDRERWEARKFLKKPKKEPEKKRLVIKDVRQFFGPVVENSPTPEYGEESDAVDDEIPRVEFRLRGVSQKVTYYDPMTDLVISRREAGMHIRAAEDEYHTRKNSEPKPKVQRRDLEKGPKVNNTMGMACLFAVQKAYDDRNKAEKQGSKMEYVINMREERETAKERIKVFNENKRNKSLKEREKDHRMILDTIERREVQRLNYLNKSKDQREKSCQHQKSRRGEISFMKDFNVQNTSVSNALLRHDRQAKAEDRYTDKTDRVQSYKVVEGEQQHMVKTYLEHRQLMRQTETAMARAAIDTKMLQEANDRLMEARAHVAQQKARSAQVRASIPGPTVSNHSLPPMEDEAVQSMKGLDRWNSSLLINQGRVGRHPTTVTN